MENQKPVEGNAPNLPLYNPVDESYVPFPSDEFVEFIDDDEDVALEEGAAADGALEGSAEQEPKTYKERFAGKKLEELTPEEQEQLFDEAFGELLDLIRERSIKGELTTIGNLAEAHIIPEQYTDTEFEQGMLNYLEDEEFARELEFDDIKRLTASISYYYSDKYMANNWARASVLAAENNDVYTFASTVRFESETYPRPMIDVTLYNEPFNFDPERLEHAWELIQQDEAYKDIQVAYASNKDRYFYSLTFLSKPQADALAEYYSVERVRNV